MRSLRRLVLKALVPLWVATAAGAAPSQEPGALDPSEGIDDPKLERRLGTRVELAAAQPAPSEVGVARVFAPVVAQTSASLPPRARRTPGLKLGYRRFTFAQVGASATAGPGADEPFDVLSLDFYPISSSWRLGLSTQYGWESGTFRQGGDAFIAQSVSLGGQIPGPVVTPFIEAYAGGGYMQRTHAGLNTVATAYGQLGVDVGTEVFLARHFFLSAALGFIHAADGFVKDNAFGSFSVDTWSFKLGFGL
ncbi:MAG TPA: hypothetical protein VGK52_16845 [Polyangia bacterium]|jgi:hypothetical protein